METLEIQAIVNVGAWLMRKVAPELKGANREKFLRVKENNERLSAALIAAVASFRTRGVHLPGFLTTERDITDCAVVDAAGTGAAIQVVATWENPGAVVNQNVGDLILQRVEKKNKQYGRSGETDTHLCVFVGQNGYQNLSLDGLSEEVRKNPSFCNYWVVLPYGRAEDCRFIVCELYTDKGGERYECLVDFNPPGSVKINYMGNFLSGKPLLDLAAILKSKPR